VLLVINEAMYC